MSVLPKSHLNMPKQRNSNQTSVRDFCPTLYVRRSQSVEKRVPEPDRIEYVKRGSRGAAAVCPLRDSFPGKRSLKEAELSP